MSPCSSVSLEERSELMIDVSELLPHSGDMLLLDELVSYDGESLVATVTIKESAPFFRTAGDSTTDGVAGVPAWVGIEYMAQAIAAWSGMRGREEGLRPKPGFLIGTRKYLSNRSVFPLHSLLSIEVKLRDKHDNLGVFDCEIRAEGLKAEAVLSVFEGERPQSVLPGLEMKP